MKFRTLALAFALAAGLMTTPVLAANKPSKPYKAKKIKPKKDPRFKNSKAAKVKPRKAPKHRAG